MVDDLCRAFKPVVLAVVGTLLEFDASGSSGGCDSLFRCMADRPEFGSPCIDCRCAKDALLVDCSPFTMAGIVDASGIVVACCSCCCCWEWVGPWPMLWSCWADDGTAAELGANVNLLSLMFTRSGSDDKLECCCCVWAKVNDEITSGAPAEEVLWTEASGGE